MTDDADREVVIPAADEPLEAEVVTEQDEEMVTFATEFLKKIVRLRGVHVDRSQFLRSELHRRGLSTTAIEDAIAGTPGGSGISPDVLDGIARAVIEFETRKSTALSFTAGLPGGFAMLGTVPADITQFYVHAFRIMQKLAYVYGWKDFLTDTEEIDDETLGKLAAFLGVMMGVAGASGSVTSFAVNVAAPAVQKQIANKALTKTMWYGPMKSTLKLVGVQVTKQSLAKTVSKVVPVVGGVVSGSLTFVTLRTQASRLMSHLREIPPPNVDAAAYLAAVATPEDRPAPVGAPGRMARLGRRLRRGERGADSAVPVSEQVETAASDGSAAGASGARSSG